MAFLSVAVIGACNSPPSVIIREWMPLIRLNGITYHQLPQYGQPDIIESDLGPQIAEIKFKLAGNVRDPDYKVKDGDAAYLEVGTPIHSINGYLPKFRVAVVTNGGMLLVFQAR